MRVARGVWELMESRLQSVKKWTFKSVVLKWVLERRHWVKLTPLSKEEMLKGWSKSNPNHKDDVRLKLSKELEEMMREKLEPNRPLSDCVDRQMSVHTLPVADLVSYLCLDVLRVAPPLCPPPLLSNNSQINFFSKEVSHFSVPSTNWPIGHPLQQEVQQ